MYSQHPHHPLRPQQQQPQQPQQPQSAYPTVMDPYNPSYTGNIVRHQLPPPPPPHRLVIPPEPTPNESTTLPLSIPELADFASMMVYLIWHARRPSVMALHDLSKTINHTQQTADHQLRHSRETATIASRTSVAFKKFCKQVLTATQLSESVILLSLKYIAMLLQHNPNIQGAEGSEYRLFTVALMLGNKFLDDNTFTNKTWSEVTGMNVRDLNVMELEFLDVLGFKLFIQKDEFERYKGALLLFRNQLLNADGHLLEDSMNSIANVQQQQQQQQNRQQYQLMLMLSKAQLPHLPTQPLNRPLTRVPLRIPVQPVWRQNVVPTPTSSTVDYYHYPNSNPASAYSTPASTYQAPQQPMRPAYNYYTPTESYYSNNNRPQQVPPYYPENTDIYSRQVNNNTNPNYHPQTHIAAQQPYSTNNNSSSTRPYRRPTGPVPEDPSTAMESYQSHRK